MTTSATHFTVKTTKRRKILYWVSTSFAALALAASGAADLVREPEVVEGLGRLGYPTYLATILGIWELLGSITIILPGLPRFKEWAYAGVFFTLSGAAISHAVVGDPLGKVLVPLALLVAVMVSWVLQPVRGSDGRKAATTQGDTAWLVGNDTAGKDGVPSPVLHKY